MLPTLSTVKRLCTLSRNRCAFPGCPRPLVDDDSGAVLGEVCHIKARSKGGPRFDPSQTDEERNAFANLVLMCAACHKIIDGDPERYPVERLQQMKADHGRTADVEVQPIDATRAALILKNYTVRIQGHLSIGTLQATSVTFKTSRSRRATVPLPADVIGGSSPHRRYIKHLVKRYQEFASQQARRNFRHAAIYSAIKKKFGTTWEWVPLSSFTAFAAFLHSRIDNTLLGRVNKSRGTRNYSSFAEYEIKYGAPGTREQVL